MFSNLKSFGLSALKFLVVSFVLVGIVILCMPMFPSIHAGWSKASPYVLCIKYLVMTLCFIYWNQLCIFFIANVDSRQHYINLRNVFLVLVIFIELVTWLGRGGV